MGQSTRENTSQDLPLCIQHINTRSRFERIQKQLLMEYTASHETFTRQLYSDGKQWQS